MRIGIIGGAGKVGRAVFAEAVRRGDVPTAIVRDQAKAEGVLGDFGSYLTKDALQLTASDLSTFDVVVDAMGVPPAHAPRHVQLAKHLVSLVRGTPGPRLFFVLDAASLTTHDGRLRLDELYEQPGTASWIGIPEQQRRELTFLNSATDVDWTGVSPSADLVVGPAKSPVLGDDALLYDDNGASRVSTGTLAVAILDEIHAPAHQQRRFTVRDA